MTEQSNIVIEGVTMMEGSKLSVDQQGIFIEGVIMDENSTILINQRNDICGNIFETIDPAELRPIRIGRQHSHLPHTGDTSQSGS